MHTRTLGQGLQVSAIGLGAMGISMSYGANPGSRSDMVGVLRGAELCEEFRVGGSGGVEAAGSHRIRPGAIDLVSPR